MIKKLLHSFTFYFMIITSVYLIYSFYNYAVFKPSLSIKEIHLVRDKMTVDVVYDEDGNIQIKAKDKIVIVFNTNNFNDGVFLIESIYRGPLGTEFQINNTFKNVEEGDKTEIKNLIVDFRIPEILKPHCGAILYGRMSYSNDKNIFLMFSPKTVTTQKIKICITD